MIEQGPAIIMELPELLNAEDNAPRFDMWSSLGRGLKVDREAQCHFVSAGSYERRRQEQAGSCRHERIGLRGPKTGADVSSQAKVIATNAEEPANAYKEILQHSYVCLDLGTP